MEEPTTIDLTALEQAPAPEAPPRSGRRVRRIVGIAAVGVAAFIGLFLLYLFGASRITEDPEPATAPS